MCALRRLCLLCLALLPATTLGPACHSAPWSAWPCADGWRATAPEATAGSICTPWCVSHSLESLTERLRVPFHTVGRLAGPLSSPEAPDLSGRPLPVHGKWRWLRVRLSQSLVSRATKHDWVGAVRVTLRDRSPPNFTVRQHTARGSPPTGRGSSVHQKWMQGRGGFLFYRVFSGAEKLT